MAIIFLTETEVTLDLQQVREKIATFEEHQLLFNLMGNRFEVELKPANDKLKYVVGVARVYEVDSNNRRGRRKFATKIFGSIFNDGKALSLKKPSNGNWINNPEDYKIFDTQLMRVLKYITIRMLDVEMENVEFVPPPVEYNDDGTACSIVLSSAPSNIWGTQSCEDFKWSTTAQSLMDEGAKLHKWCSRCDAVTVCPKAAQIAEVRKRKPANPRVA